MNGAIRVSSGFFGQVILVIIAYGFLLCLRAPFTAGLLVDLDPVQLLASILGGAVLLLLPSIAPAFAAVLLMLAGRSMLPPLWTGQFDVSALLSIGFILYGIQNVIVAQRTTGKIRANLHPIVVLVVVFSVVYIGRFFFSTHTDYALEKVIKVALVSLILMFVYSQALTSHEMRFQFSKYYLVIIGIMSSVSLVLTVVQHGIVGIQRIAPIGGGPITLGRFTGFAAVMCIAMYLGHGKRRYLLLFSWFLGFTMLNGSRGPMLALLATIIFLVVGNLITGVNWHRWVKLAAFLGLSLIGLVVAFLVAVAAQIPFAMRYVLLIEEEGGGASAGARTDMIGLSLGFVGNAPFWGSGVASWENVSGGLSSHIYPHNIFAELAVENGMLSLFLFLMMIIGAMTLGVFLLVSHKNARDYSDTWIGVGLLVFSIIGAQVSGDIYDNRYIWASIGWLTAVACFRPANVLSAATNGFTRQANVTPRPAS